MNQEQITRLGNEHNFGRYTPWGIENPSVSNRYGSEISKKSSFPHHMWSVAIECHPRRTVGLLMQLIDHRRLRRILHFAWHVARVAEMTEPIQAQPSQQPIVINVVMPPSPWPKLIGRILIGALGLLMLLAAYGALERRKNDEEFEAEMEKVRLDLKEAEQARSRANSDASNHR